MKHIKLFEHFLFEYHDGKIPSFYLLNTKSKIDTKNPLKNEFVNDDRKGVSTFILFKAYPYEKPIIMKGSGSGYGVKEGDDIQLYDDINKTTKFVGSHRTVRGGGRTTTIKQQGNPGKVIAVANSPEEITKNFPEGSYQLLVMK